MKTFELLEQAEEAYILAIREGIVLPEMSEEQKMKWYHNLMESKNDEMSQEPF